MSSSWVKSWILSSGLAHKVAWNWNTEVMSRSTSGKCNLVHPVCALWPVPRIDYHHGLIKVSIKPPAATINSIKTFQNKTPWRGSRCWGTGEAYLDVSRRAVSRAVLGAGAVRLADTFDHTDVLPGRRTRPGDIPGQTFRRLRRKHARAALTPAGLLSSPVCARGQESAVGTRSW